MKIAIIDSLTCIDIIDQKLSINDILTRFYGLSDHHDSEIKIYRSDIKNYIASFNWKGINQWKVDCPLELYKIHRQRYATKEECALLIKKLYQHGNLDTEDIFLNVPIRHFTLDEMIQFKKEDEMMLRGEDPDSDFGNEQPQTLPKKHSTPKNEKESISSMAMSEQLGTDKKDQSSTSSKTKSKIATPKKPSSSDDSFFNI